MSAIVHMVWWCLFSLQLQRQTWWGMTRWFVSQSHINMSVDWFTLNICDQTWTGHIDVYKIDHHHGWCFAHLGVKVWRSFTSLVSVSVLTPLLQTTLAKDKVMFMPWVFPENGKWAIYWPAIAQLINIPCPKNPGPSHLHQCSSNEPQCWGSNHGLYCHINDQSYVLKSLSIQEMSGNHWTNPGKIQGERWIQWKHEGHFQLHHSICP